MRPCRHTLHTLRPRPFPSARSTALASEAGKSGRFFSLGPSGWSLRGIVLGIWVTLAVHPLWAVSPEDETNHFVIERTVATQGFDGTKCWVHARAGAIPQGAPGHDGQRPLVVMTLQKLLLTGSDVFYALNEMRTEDGGKTWTEPARRESFSRQTVEADKPLPTGAEIAPQLVQPGDETTVCDFSPMWHAASQRLLGIGHTVWYRNNKVMHTRPRGVAYAVYDTARQTWKPWKTVQLPDEPQFKNAGAGSVQRVDLLGGDVLTPIYFKRPDDKQYSVTVLRLRFDGRTLEYVSHGNSLTIPVKRGLYEPSLTRFQNKFYLTMRNDDHGYVSVSDDGQRFSKPQRWTFDDGQDLGNYNTQQHWATHQDALYLIYTRKGAGNDHVFRHRAPLFIAQVDPVKLRVIRDTERIAAPEKGARMGNFGVVDVSPEETWVTVTEWMQPAGVERHGSDNRVYVTKLKWKRPNTAHNIAARANDSLDAYTQPPRFRQNTQSPRPLGGDYQSPLVGDDDKPIATLKQWQDQRERLRADWESLLGKWPPLLKDQQLEIVATKRREGITQHTVQLKWAPHETTTGYLLIPDGRRRRPAVISVFYEPETALGEGGPYRDFAIQLAKRGFVALSLGTTKASAAQTYALYHPSIEEASVAPLSMLGYAAANAWHALANRPEVDSERIGIVGHSFGGKWSMFAACQFEEFACAAWSDPGIVFDVRPSVNYWEPWYLGYHPKPWRKRGLVTDDNPARGLYPRLIEQGRDLHELHALMAPRPFLVSGGSEDPPARWAALHSSLEINKLYGHDDRVMMTNRPDHSPNADSNEVIYRFFQKWLEPVTEPTETAQ